MKKTFKACGYTERFSYVIRPFTLCPICKTVWPGLYYHAYNHGNVKKLKTDDYDNNVGHDDFRNVYLAFLISTTRQPIMCLATLKSPAKDSDCVQKQASDDTT